jgi:tetratricopeptide (TPR) repeat protein
MQFNPDEEDRKLIPRWRSLQLVPSDELRFSGRQSQELDSSWSVSDVEQKWRSHKNISNAADFVFECTLAGNRKIAQDAAKFLVESPYPTKFVKQIARSYLGLSNTVSTNSQKQNDWLECETEPQKSISKFRSRLIDDPRDAISRIELARSYVLLGQPDRASKHIEIATSLFPQNRMILRSACRFYVHAKRPELAVRILAQGNLSDPWVLAAYLSVCEIANRKLPSLRSARELLAATSDPSQVTELASTLATIELEAGNIRQAKKYFKKSVEKPNDNTVAQLRWASAAFKFDFEGSLLGTERSYEARSTYYLDKGRYLRAATECMHWLLDEPFSLRPALIGSYMCCEFLDSPGQAIWFAERGLIANPNDTTLLNNLAFAEAASGKTEIAQTILSKIIPDPKDSSIVPMVVATKGFIRLKEGNFEGAVQCYSDAMRMAVDAKDNRLANRIFLHLVAYLEREIGRMPSEITAPLKRNLEKLGAQDKQIKQEHDHFFGQSVPASSPETSGLASISLLKENMKLLPSTMRDE